MAVISAGLFATASSALLGLRRSLWFDEGYTVLVVTQPLSRMMRLLVVDVHPPLYYLVLRCWIHLVGSSVFALRLLSALFCGLTVVVLAYMLRLLTDRRHALLILPFVAVAPLLLRYGYEIRMYSLLSLISVLGTYVLLLAIRSERQQLDAVSPRGATRRGRLARWIYNSRWWMLYALVVALGMYTQYIIAIVWISHAIMLGYRTVKRHSGNLSWLFAYGFAVILYLPWLPTAIAQLRNPALPQLTGYFNVSTMLSLLTILVTGLDSKRVTAGLSLLLIVLFSCLIACRWRLSDRMGRIPSARRALRIMSSCFALPLLLILLVSSVREITRGAHSFFTIRYACAFAPYGYAYLGILCVYGAEARTTRIRRLRNAPRRQTGKVRALVYISRRWSAWSLSLLALGAGSIGYIFQGNYNYEMALTPHALDMAAHVPCSGTTAVVARDEFVYIDAYYYFRDCDNYYFLNSGQVNTVGGYAPLHGSSRQLRSLDELGTAKIMYLGMHGDRRAIFHRSTRFVEDDRKWLDEFEVVRLSAASTALR